MSISLRTSKIMQVLLFLFLLEYWKNKYLNSKLILLYFIFHKHTVVSFRTNIWRFGGFSTTIQVTAKHAFWMHQPLNFWLRNLFLMCRNTNIVRCQIKALRTMVEQFDVLAHQKFFCLKQCVMKNETLTLSKIMQKPL